ncbi:protein of unknown function [Xenorhabdus poinarii G6]|uniref:Uncharacterized protein n=1 Tax=Xenorhabdus poinarii G6 TaxID=1354304 RepID=A0A068R335_9GAMM|nr:protein of unknown function [Xenorhabdus poinarii G6]
MRLYWLVSYVEDNPLKNRNTQFHLPIFSINFLHKITQNNFARDLSINVIEPSSHI